MRIVKILSVLAICSCLERLPWLKRTSLVERRWRDLPLSDLLQVVR